MGWGYYPTTLPSLPQIGASRATCTTATVTLGGHTFQSGLEPSTSHTSAMVVGMADGSVRTVGSGVSQTTWGYVCNPADGMPLGSDW
jgi:hypothetical protein